MHYDNLNVKASHLRDVYLEAEKDYIEFLLKTEDLANLIVYFNNHYKPDVLFKYAEELVDKVEAGEFTDEEMEKVEKKLIVLLAAIQDKILIKGPLIRLPDNDEELGHGRSR